MQLSLQEIAHILHVPGVYEGCVTGFRQDSRFVEAGDLFFAIEGERVDGHDFLQEAAKKGALVAIVSSEYQGHHFGLQLIRVADTLAALQDLARQIQSRRKGFIVGITGSVGKTTMKEFIAELLEGHFRVAKTPGNANSQVGLPLTLLNAKGDEEVFVLEMGMNHAGEIEKLVSIAPPDLAVITRIGRVHSEFFPGGVEEIAAAKAEIFSHPKTKKALVQAQTLHFSAFQKSSCTLLSYAHLAKEGDFVSYQEDQKVTICYKEERTPPLHFSFEAEHLLENAIGAASTAHLVGLSWEQIAKKTMSMKPFSKRFEQLEREGVIFINDAYNASPLSVTAALRSLPAAALGKKRIAVLGSMKELGSYEKQAHREVAQVALRVVDHLLCLGEECEPMVDIFSEQGKSVEQFLELGALKERLFALAQEGDVVLIKGANSHALWRLLD